MTGLLAQTPLAPITFGPLAPELILVGTALVLMLVDALQPKTDRRAVAAVAFAGVLGAAAASISLWFWHGRPLVLGGMIEADRFAVFFRLVILGVAALAVLLSQH